MVLATVFGGMVGIEREWSNHAAGFRTHILVCLGSATIMLLSVYGFSDFVDEPQVRVDPARLAAQVISGIGFLGAGAILRNGNMIKGLTTAASVWVVAAIGLCVGAGFYTGAGICTFLVLISLYLLNRWEKHLLRHRRVQEVELVIKDDPGVLAEIASAFGEQGIQIANLRMNPAEDHPAERYMQLIFSLKLQNPERFIVALERISLLEKVISLETGNMDAGKSRGAKSGSVSM
ncbi:MgtC/SapB family protein [Cohnella herbarum]|uniref:MgtC/SapB family protein n=2 Tax=Cohnella herbarum TaxID=2728023 RepID=A0A7Z2VT21_9BACL|nr:MgtC/SapB family protein [Cohnella herbarum]QJD88440.1 MgtC/SapB family protein [Cohnella herbarum]